MIKDCSIELSKNFFLLKIFFVFCFLIMTLFFLRALLYVANMAFVDDLYDYFFIYYYEIFLTIEYHFESRNKKYLEYW